MEQEEFKFSKDDKCPYCGSGNVKKGIISFGARASSTPKYPEPNIEIWNCLECKKEFYR